MFKIPDHPWFYLSSFIEQTHKIGRTEKQKKIMGVTIAPPESTNLIQAIKN